MTTIALAQKVEQMRKAQKNYFKIARTASSTQREAALMHSKQLEKEVDETVKEILHPVVNPAQASMFATH